MKIHYAFIVISLISLIMGCGGAEERKSAYLEKAKKFMAAGDFDKARIDLKNVIQIDPKEDNAYFLLGKIFESRRDYNKAFINYNKASELDPGNSEYHAKLGLFYLVLAKDIDKAIEKRDIILKSEPDNIYGLMLKASILRKQEKIDEAKKISQEIFSSKPEIVENSVFLASIYHSEKRFDDAVLILKKCIANNKNNELLSNLLANTYIAAGKYGEAENEIKSAVNRNQDLFASHLRLSVFYQKTKKIDMALAALRNTISDENEDNKRKLYLIDFVNKNISRAAAIKETEALIAETPDLGDLRIILAKLYAEEGNANKSMEVLRTAISDFSDDSTGVKSRVYLASIFLAQDNPDQASSIIQEAIEISPSDPGANLVKAKIALIENDTEIAIIALRVVIKNDPQNMEGYFLLAAAHNLISEKEQAEDIINQAYANNRTNSNALLELSEYHIKNKNYNQAEKIIDDLLEIDGNNLQALSMKIDTLTNSKRFEDAKPYVDLILKMYPDKEDGYLYSALSLLGLKQNEEAVKVLTDGYEKTNHARKILHALTEVQISLKDFDTALDRINKEIAANKNDANLYMALSNVYIASGDLANSEKYLKHIISINPKVAQAYTMLAKIYAKQKSKPEAYAILNEGLKANENDYAILQTLASLYESDGNYDGAINSYEKIMETTKDKVIVINNLAALLVDHRNDETSLNRAKELADIIKGVKQPAVLDTVGWVYYKLEDYNNAVSVLSEAVNGMPDNAIFNYHLGMAYYKLNNNKLAKEFLTKAVKSDSKYLGRDEAENILKSL